MLSGGPPGGVVAMAQMVAVLAARKPLVIAVESITAAGSMFAQEIVRFANVLGSAPVLIVALLGQHDEGIGAAAKCRKVLCGDSGFLDGAARAMGLCSDCFRTLKARRLPLIKVGRLRIRLFSAQARVFPDMRMEWW